MLITKSHVGCENRMFTILHIHLCLLALSAISLIGMNIRRASVVGNHVFTSGIVIEANMYNIYLKTRTTLQQLWQVRD